MTAIFDGIRLSVFKSFVEKKLNRDIVHRPISISNAEKIGILFHADNEPERKAVQVYAEALKLKGKEVQLLGYLKHRNHQVDYLFPYITPKDANWFGKPKGGTIGYFIKYPFDLLINFSLKEILPLEYIAALSHAGFRVGFNEKGVLRAYDCVFLADHGRDTNGLIENFEKYLS